MDIIHQSWYWYIHISHRIPNTATATAPDTSSFLDLGREARDYPYNTITSTIQNLLSFKWPVGSGFFSSKFRATLKYEYRCARCGEVYKSG